MTIGAPKTFNIKSVAVIGAGPSGIAALYDLSRTTKDGESLFNESDISKYEKEGSLAFPNLVAFERHKSVGGVWNKDAYAENNTDANYPDFEGDADDDVIDLSNPANIYKDTPISKELEAQLQDSSFENPVRVPFDEIPDSIFKNQWRSSGAYHGLFTNVTNRYMQFSFNERIGNELKDIDTKYKHVPNFQSAGDVGDYLTNTVKKNNLAKYIRFNSNVEKVTKLENSKWEVVVTFIDSDPDGKKFINWYKQTFDAVVICNGKTIPIVPNIKNLVKFAKVNEDKVIFRLAKSVRDPKLLKNGKKILFIGSSVSTVDLMQYAFPRDLDNPTIYISRQSEIAGSTWITLSSHSRGIINKPTISEFLPESNSVKFSDGTIESNFDVIIIGTGYHMHYPFIDKSVIDNNPSIFKFYKYTFSIDDPTLALIGNTYAVFFFNRVEAQAAAISGVWSNTKKLPSREEQLKDYERKPPLIAPVIDKEFIKPLMEFSSIDRPHPFDVNKEKHDHIYHISVGSNTLLDLFFKVRNGEISPDNILAVNN
ncbi:hypothetical protein C6P40_004418 [Pichia californica]|uniref:Uncharacterized protein n=1 Tax=Pichia californica TaxID=460514 RepID=A0A9P6WQ18_9ASCO|nr:hypothetical protein C6P42_005296 [[Candida] californica]KAG0691167.1 hypothetical protein C6P40_004418 [[Candida] californica]